MYSHEVQDIVDSIIFRGNFLKDQFFLWEEKYSGKG
jgi:hypothetical protein